MHPAVLVTGAATGIGRAFAVKAAGEGAHVFAGVRKARDADDLRERLGAAATPIVFDVTDAGAVRAACEQVGDALGSRRLMGLVNNAGVAVAGPLIHLAPEELRAQLEVNLIGVHRVTQAFAPLLGVDPDRSGPPGRIVMISSVSGVQAMPFLGPYAASKHALEGYAQALRRELIAFGVDVVSIRPGPVATPIWDKAAEIDAGRYQISPYAATLAKLQGEMVKRGRAGLPPETVAALIWKVLRARRPRVHYTLLRQKLLQHDLPRLLPERVLDGLIARALGLTPRA